MFTISSLISDAPAITGQFGLSWKVGIPSNPVAIQRLWGTWERSGSADALGQYTTSTQKCQPNHQISSNSNSEHDVAIL